eukprot:TRINITY_DN53097_c0_g1_i1.p2 TRINITY_DN53097_c0_g1~~TRINITY_DN53097_c0_g1_i1.p2  ORF type:complete len:123 (-),score=35.33 TRINITY_DN53097_c0_g1_i1:87-455(-)
MDQAASLTNAADIIVHDENGVVSIRNQELEDAQKRKKHLTRKMLKLEKRIFNLTAELEQKTDGASSRKRTRSKSEEETDNWQVLMAEAGVTSGVMSPVCTIGVADAKYDDDGDRRETQAQLK